MDRVICEDIREFQALHGEDGRNLMRIQANVAMQTDLDNERKGSEEALTFRWKKKGAVDSVNRNDVSTATDPEKNDVCTTTEPEKSDASTTTDPEKNYVCTATEELVLLSADNCVFDRIVVQKTSSVEEKSVAPVDNAVTKDGGVQVGHIVNVLEEVRKEVFYVDDSNRVDFSDKVSALGNAHEEELENTKTLENVVIKTNQHDDNKSFSLMRGMMLKVKNDIIESLCTETCESISKLKFSAWRPFAKMLLDGEDEENILKSFLEEMWTKDNIVANLALDDMAELDKSNEAVQSILELGECTETKLIDKAKDLAKKTIDNVNRILAINVDDIIKATENGKCILWPESTIEGTVADKMRIVLAKFMKEQKRQLRNVRIKSPPKRLLKSTKKVRCLKKRTIATLKSSSPLEPKRTDITEKKSFVKGTNVQFNEVKNEIDANVGVKKKSNDDEVEKRADDLATTYSWSPGEEQDGKLHHLVSSTNMILYHCGQCSNEFPSLRALGYHAGCSPRDPKLTRPVQIYYCCHCYRYASTQKNIGGHWCQESQDSENDELLDWEDLVGGADVKPATPKIEVESEEDSQNEELMDFDDDLDDSDYKPEEEPEQIKPIQEKEPKSLTRPLVLKKESSELAVRKRKKAPARQIQKSCDICNMTFESGIIYRTHARTVHGLIKACRKCNIEFKSKSEHDLHVKTKHADPLAIKCIVCDASFIVRHTFFKHLAQHTTSITCNDCGMDLVNGETYAEHLKTIHADVVRPNLKRCNRCCLDFDSKRDRDRHYWTVHERPKVKEEFPEPMPCHICGKLYRKCKYMENHLKRHAAGWKPRVCPKCGIQRWSREAYKKHLRQHEGELFYRCRRCKTSYATRADLVQHQVEMHGRKPVTTLKAKVSAGIKCEHCGEIFRDTRLLSKHHAEVHVAERPFCCHICGIRYPRKTALNHHLNRHKEGGPFPCLYCGTEYPTRLARWDHQKTAHDEQIRTCTVCGRLVPTRKGLKIHVKSHFMVKKGFVNEETRIMMKNVLSDLSFYS